VIRSQTARAKRSTGTRALALAAASCCLLGHGTNLTHFLFVRHAICAEHGDLVHAGEASEHAAAAHAGLATAAPALQTMPTSEPAHGDEHCAIVSDRREHALRSSSQELHAPAAADLAQSVAARAAPRAAVVPIFLLAPKSSPPV
jgi:hypothetical protein